jgi:hypothetical protein
MENPSTVEVTTPNFFSVKLRAFRDSVLNALEKSAKQKLLVKTA